MKAPTQKDIDSTASGYRRLPCDGRHEHTYHFYMYYTKKEIISMWKEQHPMQIGCDTCGDPIDADIHKEELGMCVDCSNEYFTHDDEEGETK